MFVEFECGCIGLVGGHADEHRRNAVVIKACDRSNEQGDYSFLYRDMSDKRYKIVPKTEEKEIVKAISQLVGDGYLIKQFTNTLQYLLQRD